MEKLNMQTTDVVDENIKRIGEMFPNCLTEVKDEKGRPQVAIDFDQLRQELSKNIVEGPEERYQFTWPDKRNAIRLANAPTTDTLRPCREESVDFDNTQNLYIEGDNLQVLKLLRENYLGKVKMIYIDPPYNTGNDFVYNDEFSQEKQEFIHNSGMRDEDGNWMVQDKDKNTEANGRFHTDWLNMIYPRLKVAKDLLSEDGVIFISINDCEVYNLKKVCDEIFGVKQYITSFVWEKGKEGGNDSSIMRSHYESILFYCKNIASNSVINLDEKDTSRHIVKDKEKNLVKGIESYPNEGELFQLVNLSKQKDYNVKIPLIDGDIIKWPSYAPQTTIDKWIKIGKVFVGAKKVPYVKSYLKDELNGQKPSNIIGQEYGTTKAGSIEIREIFGSREFFSYPKPSILIKRFLSIGAHQESIILDFFSGSASTAHAVMQLNAEDGGKRKFIMVQLPEATDEKSEAYKAGYKNICEIGKERIRRAGKKIKEESPLTTQDLDTGFRVLKLDSSNMQDVYYTPEEFDQRDLFEDNIKPDRTEEDLLFQTMIDLGIELSAKIEQTQIAGKTVWNVSDGYLMACFDEAVNETTITEIAKQQPYYFVMRDKSLANDNVADNFEQIFNHYSKDTIRRIL